MFIFRYSNFLLLFLLITVHSVAQQVIQLRMTDSITRQGIPSVTISKKSKVLAVTDSTGFASITLTTGNHLLILSSVGYEQKEWNITAPVIGIQEIHLSPQQKALEEVTVISSTRNNQRMENSPLKVEVLGKEEMNEENTIKPGNIASILGDVSGIQIQQSSAVTGNANVRIQGLDGRYTQILRDGMPLFDGFSGGFGILQIPPLDLKQVELIKGSASTLYGGGAIGGLINLISKKPSHNQEAVLTLNQTTLKESNINTWLSKRYKHAGYTLFAGYTKQGAADVNKDGLSDVAKNDAFILHPRLFFYPDDKTTIATGYTSTFEKRTGGDMQVIANNKDAVHQFFETNNNKRHTGDLTIERSLTGGQKLEVKASLSSFTRGINSNTNYFKGNQLNYFTELSLFIPKEKSSWVMGVNTLGERFKKLPSNPVLLNNYNYNTIGAFVQSTFNLPKQTTLETGLRFDHHNRFGNFVLPRIAIFHRFNDQWATRAGIGFGYKAPNPLSVQNTDYTIEKIQPLNNSVKAEHSIGYNAEVNYKREWGQNTLFINQAFFLTQINQPVIATVLANQEVSFNNASKSIITKGSDTYVRLELSGWEIYVGYTFTIAERRYLQQNQFVPLTPKNRFAFTLVKEIQDKWRFGLEGSYTGKQYREDATKTPGYFFMAGMIERKFGKHFSMVLNGENLLNYRQSNTEALYTGTITNPQFKPLWAPIDGRVVNISMRMKL
jgi:outer membrane receptor for ferrienterochelin and colicins